MTNLWRARRAAFYLIAAYVCRQLTRCLLGCGLIKPEPKSNASDFEHGEVVECTTVVSGSDVAELLEFIEAPFDQIAFFVFGFAVGDAVIPVRSGRNMWRAILILDQIPDPIRVIALVSDHVGARRKVIEQEFSHGLIVHLARRQLDLHGQSVANNPQVQLGRQPSTTSTDTSVSSLFFWAAACW